MAKIEDGKVIDTKVEIKTYPSLEHGGIGKVTSIVLHRTGASKTEGTLDAYAKGQKTGAHFLVDKSGHIFQTASLKKSCHHVGILLPRCDIEKNCDPNELRTITALMHEKGLSFSRRARNLSHHETGKKYPLRYPNNSDSIGIEVAGKFLEVEGSFEEPTVEQFSSLKWLVGVLIEEYGLSLRTDIYAHGAIARKKVSEGAQLLQYLFSGKIQ